MRDTCYFLRGDNKCRLLEVNFCCNPDKCKFFKTEAQFNEDRDHSIEICREKGICHTCAYTSGRPCKLSTEAPDWR